jgi:Vacuolar sorting-associated protein 13, N-terminal
MSEWNDNLIIDEFHASKQSTLDAYEEEAKFQYVKKKDADTEMSHIVLNIIQNIHITVERVYVRIEDPYPFALGILIPSITVSTSDSNYRTDSNDLKNDRPEIAFKVARIDGLSIFMERDQGEVNIDDIIGVTTEPNMPMEVKEKKIYQHVRDIFAASAAKQMARQRRVQDFDQNDFILKKLDVDVRL